MKVLLLACLLAVAFAAQEKVLGHRTARNHPQAWRLGAAADDSHVLTFIVALKQQNLDVLEEQYWAVTNPDSPRYRNFLSISEILDIVQPPTEHKDVVVQWLRSAGVRNIVDLGDALEVQTTVAVASSLYNTRFAQFEHKEKASTIVRQFGQYSVPASVAEYIDLVSGLSEFPVPRYSLKSSPASPDVLVSIAPQTIQTIYQIPASQSVTGNSSVSVIEFVDQYYSPDELNQFNKEFNLAIPALTPNHIVGSNDPTNPQVEATLDIQYALGVATNAQGWFWIEKDNVWLYGFAVHFFGTPSVPLINSISYGWNEEDQCEDGIGGIECQQLGVDSKGYVQRVNVEFQKIGLRGVALISASGDSGANGRTDPDCSENHLNPPFPGASPYITAVGATQISEASGVAKLPSPPPGCSNQRCASAGTEECVSFAQANFASGGGFSVVSPAPAFQVAAIQNYTNSGVKLPPSSYYNGAGRGFPDIAAFGSQVLIYSGGIEPVGGTSASAPIIAGVFGLINDKVNSATGKPLGPLNPLLYKMAVECPNCFTDITVGDNICTEDGCSPGCKGFYAAKGWDPVSGLGTPVFPNILRYLSGLLKVEL